MINTLIKWGLRVFAFGPEGPRPSRSILIFYLLCNQEANPFCFPSFEQFDNIRVILYAKTNLEYICG